MSFSNLAKDFLDRCVIEFKKDKNQQYIENEIVQPILDKISKKITPYFTIFFVMYILLLILIVIIFIMLFQDTGMKKLR